MGTNARWFLTACAAIVVIGCEMPAGSDGDDGGPMGPPRPYVPPAEGAPECELAADCPEGTFCDLGECIQQCNIVDPCTGELTCLPRGRCAESLSAPSDPPPSAEHVATVRADAEAVAIGPSDAMALIQFSAEPTDAEVRYRVVSRVPWLRVREPRGTFTGALAVMLEVDRTGVGVGSHTGTVLLRTTAGDVTVPVQLTQSFTGVYQGEIRYEEPRTLGAVPVRIEVQDRGGFVDVRVLSSDSPTFPVAGREQATTTANVSGGRIDGSLVQSFAASDLGEASAIARPIGRDLQFMLEPTQAGGLAGSFSERWVGLFPAAVTVRGTMTLARMPDAPRDFVVAPSARLPGNPAANPPAIAMECLAATAPVAGFESGAACTAASSPTQLRACGERVLARATAFEGAALVVRGERPGESGYDSLSALCANDVDDESLAFPSRSRAACFHAGNYECALTLLEHAAQRGDGPAAGLVGEAAARRAGVAMLLLNEHLVDAFELPVRSEATAIESAVLEELAAGRGYARPALAELYEPHVLEALRATAPGIASSTDHRGLRRFAQLVARDRLAADQEASIRIRTRPAERETTRTRIHAEALDLLLGLVALSTIEAAQEAPASAELGLFAEALTELGRRSLQAGERIDPLGVPAIFVPFMLDATRIGPGSATNFEQTLSAYSRSVQTAVTDENAARAAVREFETNEASLRNELNAIDDQVRNRLLAICGPVVGGDVNAPDVENCGGSGIGELAEARGIAEEAGIGVQVANARFEGLLARAAIQRGRAAAVRGIREDTLTFLTRTNAQINTREIESIAIEAVQSALAIAANSQVWNGGAPAAMGVATGILEGLQGAIRLEQQELRQAQELRVREDEADIEYLNAMSALQEMLVGQHELALEVTQATLRAATAQIRRVTLEVEVEQLQAERAMLEARALSGLSNDPAFRVLRSRAIEQAIASRERALVGVYLAARAFEYETNAKLDAIDTGLVPAMRAAQVERFANECLLGSQTAFRTAYGAPQTFVDEVSLREDVFGIRGPIEDDVTGEVISEAEQFRRLLLAPSNLGSNGTVELTFGTSLNPGNGLFSTAVCNDQIRSLQVRFIGDGLGDDTARAYLVQSGASIQRGCESGRDGAADVLRQWDVQPRRAEVQVGINVASAAPADMQFAGRSVSATEWRLAIPPGDVAPANADLDLTRIDDIVIRVEHSAISISDGPIRYAPTCGGT